MFDNCNPGFMRVTANATCSTSATWIGVSPCVLVNDWCPAVFEVDGITMDCSADQQYDAICGPVYGCSTGYERLTNEAACDVDRTWSGVSSWYVLFC